jgi:SAM-dependent methyltransferase
VIADHIIQQAQPNETLHILEAGCGNRWRIELPNVQYTLTGIDLDECALDLRQNQQCDLDVAICGDLRTITLEENEYDVVYNSYVLEHVEGAENVLKNFVSWLKPGGILIIRIPNRDSAVGFITRSTPFWLHVFWKRYFEGRKNAGKPGHSPYPTVFDRVVSLDGVYAFCEENHLAVQACYYHTEYKRKRFRIKRLALKLAYTMICLASLGKLSRTHESLIFVIKKL